MSSLPIIVCIIEAKDKDNIVIEGFKLVSKIQEIESSAVLSLSYSAENNIIITTSKSIYIKNPNLSTTVEIILKQNGYINIKGQ